MQLISTFNDFEKLAGRLYHNRLKRSIRGRVEMHHQKTFTSVTGINKYNIDIAFTYKLAGLNYLTILECKYWNSRVSREKVGHFKSVIDELKASRGIIVSKCGFQKGAIIYAKTHNITLIQLTDNNRLRIILCPYASKFNLETYLSLIVNSYFDKVFQEFYLLDNTLQYKICLN